MLISTTTKSPTKVGEKSEPATPQERAKYVIGIDWLEVTTKQVNGHYLNLDDNGQPPSIVTLADGVMLIRKLSKCGKFPLGSKAYKAQYDIQINGEDVAILQSVSRFGRPELSQLKILNHILYTSSFADVLNTIIDALGATVNNITRLDIAIDGRGFIAQHTRRREAVHAGRLAKVGKSVTKLHEGAGYNVTGFDVGNRKSGKMITGYQKGVILAEATQQGKDNKPYILQRWIDAGLVLEGDDIGEIERLELKLTAEQLAAVKIEIDGELQPIDIYRLDDAEYLAAIFRVQCNNFYQWTATAKDTNRTRQKAAKTLEAVEWEYFNKRKVNAVRAKKTAEPSVLWAARQRIAFEMRENYAAAKLAGDTHNPRAHAAEIYCRTTAEQYGILDWFTAKLPKWEREQERHTAIHAAQQAARERFAMA